MYHKAMQPREMNTCESCFFCKRLRLIVLRWYMYFFCGPFVLFMSCVIHAFASIHCGLLFTCWERVDLLALVGNVYCILLLSHVVSWARCGI